MTKWADYGISAVRYVEEHKHIETVKAHPDNGEKFGTPATWARADVVSAIERGTTFVTIMRNGEKWNKGEDVRVIEVDSQKYLRTDANKKGEDNLGSLPEF